MKEMQDDSEKRTGTCEGCSEEFEVESRVGRVPVLCDKCKWDKKSRLRQASRLEKQMKKHKRSYVFKKSVKKKKFTLSIDNNLLNEAKNVDLNVSSFLEERLAERFGYEKHEMWQKK